MFWWLDAFFQRQERLFRKLFDRARTDESAETDFSMNTQPVDCEVVSRTKVAWSPTLRWFYGSLFLAVTIAMLALKGYLSRFMHWLY
jgi:hypothetical protein